MTELDDQNEELRSKGRKSGGGHVEMHDARFSSLIKWVWAALGGVAVLIGLGVYSKLSSINDTLIAAVSDIKNQGAQVAELKIEVRDLRGAQGAMQRQVDSLEGKTLRGIEEMKRER
jgi:hypothetical protein